MKREEKVMEIREDKVMDKRSLNSHLTREDMMEEEEGRIKEEEGKIKEEEEKIKEEEENIKEEEERTEEAERERKYKNIDDSNDFIVCLSDIEYIKFENDSKKSQIKNHPQYIHPSSRTLIKLFSSSIIELICSFIVTQPQKGRISPKGRRIIIKVITGVLSINFFTNFFEKPWIFQLNLTQYIPNFRLH